MGATSAKLQPYLLNCCLDRSLPSPAYVAPVRAGRTICGNAYKNTLELPQGDHGLQAPRKRELHTRVGSCAKGGVYEVAS